jgi:hypothetical protein
MPKPSKRGQLVEATKEPLREVGYEDTPPPEAVRRYLLERAAFRGLPARAPVHEAAIEHEELRRPAAAYFDAVRSLIKG